MSGLTFVWGYFPAVPSSSPTPQTTDHISGKGISPVGHKHQLYLITKLKHQGIYLVIITLVVD